MMTMKRLLTLLLLLVVLAAVPARAFIFHGLVSGGGSSCSAGALQFNLACNAINFVMRRE